MNPAARSFIISTLMTSLRSFAKRHNFYLASLAVLLTSKECSASSMGTPGISDGVHANMSALSRRKLVSASSYLSPRLSPMTTVFSGLGRPRQTLFVDGMASRVVSVRYCYGTVRSLGATFVASAAITAEVSTQAFVMAMSRA
jgi:O-acetyl-ADP-ribose deacetylase (regulator of RNase III)